MRLPSPSPTRARTARSGSTRSRPARDSTSRVGRLGRRRRRRRGGAGAGRGPGRRANSRAHLPRARRGPTRTGARGVPARGGRGDGARRRASCSAFGPSPAHRRARLAARRRRRRSTSVTRAPYALALRGRPRLGRRGARELALARPACWTTPGLRRAAPAPDHGRAAGRRRVLAHDRRPLSGCALPRRPATTRTRSPKRSGPPTSSAPRPSHHCCGRACAQLGLRVPRGPRPSTRANPVGLTSRQLEILTLVATGATNAEIARMLFLTPKTVEHHVGAVLAKLRVDDPRRGRGAGLRARARRDAGAADANLGAVARWQRGRRRVASDESGRGGRARRFRPRRTAPCQPWTRPSSTGRSSRPSSVSLVFEGRP